MLSVIVNNFWNTLCIVPWFEILFMLLMFQLQAAKMKHWCVARWLNTRKWKNKSILWELTLFKRFANILVSLAGRKKLLMYLHLSFLSFAGAVCWKKMLLSPFSCSAFLSLVHHHHVAFRWRCHRCLHWSPVPVVLDPFCYLSPSYALDHSPSFHPFIHSLDDISPS